MRVLPLLRALKWTAYAGAARLRARIPVGRSDGNVVFIVGCGRSGTSILGDLLGRHPSVCYLDEPHHYWFAIDPRTDSTDLFGGKGQCFLSAEDATPKACRTFARLFGQARLLRGKEVVVEKYPTNALRMEWLRQLCPQGRFIHLVRDGRAVVTSIAALSRANRYRMGLGGPEQNQWWGREFHKWKVLARETQQRNGFAEALAEMGAPPDYTAMAAVEWVVSLHEVRAAIARLGLGAEQCLEIRYEDLVACPQDNLERIERWLGVPHDSVLTAGAARLIKDVQRPSPQVILPPRLHELFVQQQQVLRYPLEGVACQVGSQYAGAPAG